MQVLKFLCGVKGFYPLTHLNYYRKNANNICNSTQKKTSIGKHFALPSEQQACEIQTQWRLHPQQQFPIFVVFHNQLNLPIKIFLLNQICLVNSPSSTLI